jgi:hypothetical protein
VLSGTVFFFLLYACQSEMDIHYWAGSLYKKVRMLLILRNDLSLQDQVCNWHIATARVALFSDIVFTPTCLRFCIDQLVNSLNSCACRRASVHLLALHEARATPTWFSCLRPKTPRRSICPIRYNYRVVRGTYDHSPLESLLISKFSS